MCINNNTLSVRPSVHIVFVSLHVCCITVCSLSAYPSSEHIFLFTFELYEYIVRLNHRAGERPEERCSVIEYRVLHDCCPFEKKLASCFVMD